MNIRAGVLPSLVQTLAAAAIIKRMASMYRELSTHQFRSRHIGGVHSLAGLLNGSRKLARLVQAKPVESCTQLSVVLSQVCTDMTSTV